MKSTRKFSNYFLISLNIWTNSPRVNFNDLPLITPETYSFSVFYLISNYRMSPITMYLLREKLQLTWLFYVNYNGTKQYFFKSIFPLGKKPLKMCFSFSCEDGIFRQSRKKWSGLLFLYCRENSLCICGRNSTRNILLE